MDKQPESLRLAEAIERSWLENVDRDAVDVAMIQEELRRLHQANQELVEALKEIARETYDEWTNGAKAQRIAQAALTKHKEQV